MKLLSTQNVLAIHESVINENELQGLAKNKSLESVVLCVENRMRYGLINDVFDLAASYGVVIAIGHAFHDGNKRTAFRAMVTCLRLNGVYLTFDTEDIGQTMIKVSQGMVDEIQLAGYLRTRCT